MTTSEPPARTKHPVGRRRLSRAILAAAGAAACAALSGCASGSDRLEGRVESPPTRIDSGPSVFESEIGGMDEYATAQTFDGLGAGFARCVEQGSSRVDELGGQAEVVLRVKRDGRVRWAYLKHSTLGDRDTERCVLDLVRQQRWPRPLSGEGIAHNTFEVEPREHAPELDPERRRRALAHARENTRRCRRGVDGTFRATVYVSRDGSVKSAGVAPPSEQGESVADCVVEALGDVRFGSVRHAMAKLSFEL